MLLPVILAKASPIVAGRICKALGDSFGPKLTPDRLANALAGKLTPEQRAAINRVEHDYAIKTIELLNQDRDSARKAYVENRDWISGLVALSVCAGFLSMLGGLAYSQIMNQPLENREFLNLVMGHIMGMLSAVVAFYWGAQKQIPNKKG